MSDEELTMQGRRNWDSAVYGLEIAAENLGYRNFQQVSDNIYQTEVEVDGDTHTIAISNANDVWGNIFTLLMTENWGEAEAFVAVSAIGELPALGVARIGPCLAVRHSICLPHASVHAFTNGIQMTAIAASRVTQALLDYYTELQGNHVG